MTSVPNLMAAFSDEERRLEYQLTEDIYESFKFDTSRKNPTHELDTKTVYAFISECDPINFFSRVWL